MNSATILSKNPDIYSRYNLISCPFVMSQFVCAPTCSAAVSMDSQPEEAYTTFFLLDLLTTEVR